MKYEGTEWIVQRQRLDGSWYQWGMPFTDKARATDSASAQIHGGGRVVERQTIVTERVIFDSADMEAPAE